MLLTPLTPRFLCALLAGSLIVFSAALAGAEGKQWTFLEQASIDLRDGDRIVILGNAFWERELRDGYLETALTIASSGRSLTFRNLGFSGDTVFGDSWTYSTSHSEETNVRNRLFQLVRDQRPTVIIVNYGAVESFAGPAGLDRWSTGVKQLLDEISTTDVRIIIMPPAPFEDLGPPLPEAAFNNKRRNTYVDVLASISHERELEWWNPFTLLSAAGPAGPQFTVDGMNFSSAGYWSLGNRIVNELNPSVQDWQVEIDIASRSVTGKGTSIIDTRYATGAVEFFARDPIVPYPRRPVNGEDSPSTTRTLRILGLRDGNYALKIDGQTVHQATAKKWAAGVPLSRDPAFDQAEELRQAIVEKNRLFLHQWRPQNETYLLGFRRPEQGQHATEKETYTKLVHKMDERIGRLRVPRLRRYAFVGPLAADTKNAPSSTRRKSHANEAQLPTPVEQIAKELAAFRLAEGFEINLFAADPMIANPIGMNWDEHGRLWVAMSPLYPHIVPGNRPNDRVVILEDSDSDGRADRRTVFAKGLTIPNSVLPGDGGAYVTNSRELLHLQDTDGDGQADRTRVMLSGFGMEDTHHIIHGLHWGPDGRIHFYQSVLIFSHVETPWGVRRLGRAGLWRWDSRSQQLDVMVRGLVNPWGHQFDRWGQSFATDGAYTEGINYVFPGACFFWARNSPRILHGLNRGQPKECGLEILDGRHLPEQWQGRMITSDFRTGRIVSFEVQENESGYSSTQVEDLIAAGHSQAFRPIDIKMGPDGAIYICDWYNPVIQHGEVDFRDPRRDRHRGRIWRVTAKSRPLVIRPRLSQASTSELLAQLTSPEQWTRRQAVRLLRQRGAAAVWDELDEWVKGLDPADPSYNQHRLAALWLCQAFDTPNLDLLSSLIDSPDHRARAAAVRVLGEWHDQISDALERLSQTVRDVHPRVRLESINALRQVGSSRAFEIAMDAVDRPLDSNLDFALWLTVRELESEWLPAYQTGKLTFGGSVAQLTFVLQATRNPLATGQLLQLLIAGEVESASQTGVAGAIAFLGNPEELKQLFEWGISDDCAHRGDVLAALLEASRRRGEEARPAGDLAALQELIADDPTAIRLAGAWKVAASRKMLTALAVSESTPDEFYEAAVQSVASLAGPGSKETITQLARRAPKLARRATAIAALVPLDWQAAADIAAKFLLDESVDPASTETVVLAFLSHRDGSRALAASLKGTKLPSKNAALAAQLASGHGGNDQTLIEVLVEAGSLKPLSENLSTEDLARLVAEVGTSGDSTRGKQIYHRAQLGCVKCHAIAAKGGAVGPDLISLGGSAQVDYIVQSLLQPSSKIKEGYHATVFQLEDGRVVSGVVVKQSNQAIAVRNGQNEIVTILPDQVEERSASSVSLMPSGLMNSLRRDELIDLVRYLSELGRTERTREEPE